MPLSEHAEEVLESLWQEDTEKGNPEVSLKKLLNGVRSQTPPEDEFEGLNPESPEIRELLEAGLIRLDKENKVSLTPAGREQGEHIIRHHRLAERLLADVFDMPEGSGDDAACRFEHILKRGIDERICTLLGHPRFCPHGRPIPPGPCCREKRDASIRIVAPVSELEEGERGTIAYLHAGLKGRLDRLMALGAIPGQSIVLVQRYPSYVLRIGETQIAVDEDLAKNIYVRLGPSPPSRRRWRRKGWLR